MLAPAHARDGGEPLRHRLRALGAAAVALAMAVLLARAAWAAVVDVTATSAVDPRILTQAVVTLAALAGATVAAHLSVTTTLLALASRRSRAHAAAMRLTPRSWRRLVGMAASGAASLALAVPAGATVDVSDAGWLPHEVAVAPGQVEHASADATPAPATSPAAATHRATATVVVEPGDSLWRITEESLGDDADVAHAWPALYERNRDVVGGDPSLIRPGQRLVIPKEWRS